MVKELVDCQNEYWEFVRLLRSNPQVQGGFIDQVNITKEQQIKYMTNHAQFYRICLVDKIPAGFVGVIGDDIRVCTDPSFQKRGVGKFMIEEIMKEFPSAFAKVKIENEASLKLFESCGFTKQFYILKK
jgi:ribosomal protein S18 acetylase RimI-like enzyme